MRIDGASFFFAPALTGVSCSVSEWSVVQKREARHVKWLCAKCADSYARTKKHGRSWPTAFPSGTITQQPSFMPAPQSTLARSGSGSGSSHITVEQLRQVIREELRAHAERQNATLPQEHTPTKPSPDGAVHCAKDGHDGASH